MSEFEVGDKVIWPEHENWGRGTVISTGYVDKQYVNVRFESFPNYRDSNDYHQVDSHRLRRRTLAEKRADDAKVIGESADKVQATLESGGRDYYGGDTVLKFIEDMGLGFSLGNSVKYIARAGKKDVATKRADLVKARDYLNREIDKLGDENEG